MIDPEVHRALLELLQGRTTAAGSFDLDVSPATSTTVTKTGVSSNSVIHPEAYSAFASNAHIIRTVPAKGSFVVFHTASASARTYRYVCFTGLAT